MKKQCEFHFRHILKDGTVLKEGEKLPVTPASQAAFAKVARILIERARRSRSRTCCLTPLYREEVKK